MKISLRYQGVICSSLLMAILYSINSIIIYFSQSLWWTLTIFIFFLLWTNGTNCADFLTYPDFPLFPCSVLNLLLQHIISFLSGKNTYIIYERLQIEVVRFLVFNQNKNLSFATQNPNGYTKVPILALLLLLLTINCVPSLSPYLLVEL